MTQEKDKPVSSTGIESNSTAPNAFDSLFFDTLSPSKEMEKTDSSHDFSFFDESHEVKPQKNDSASPDILSSDFSFFEEPGKPGNKEQTDAPSVSFDFGDEEPHTSIDTNSAVLKTEPSISGKKHHTMTFTCLKCSAAVEIEHEETTETELNVQCTGCSSKIRIIIQPNANRATQKSKEIYCRRCGHSLDQHPHCPACGLFCPDYYIFENPAEAQRRARKSRSDSLNQFIANIKSAFSRSSTSKAKEFSTDYIYKEKTNLNYKYLKLAGIAALLLIVLSLPVFYYFKIQAENRYVTNYIKITYAIHTASSSLINSMTKTSNDWQKSISSGNAFIPNIDMDLETRNARINAEVSKLMQQLQSKVPGKFEQANARLLAYQKEFNKLQKATSSTPDSYDKLSALLAESEKSLTQKRQEVKASLNSDLMAELETAKKKYRGFDGF